MRIQQRDRFAIWASKLIAKAQAKLHVSPQSLVLLDWDVLDANGKFKARVRGKSHSLVRNYHAMASTNAIFPPAAPVDSKTDGSYAMYNTIGSYSVAGPGGKYPQLDGIINSYGYGTYSASTGGIHVGRGTDAESFEDYKLQDKLSFSIDNSALAGITYTSNNTTQKWDSVLRTWSTTHIRGCTNDGGKSTEDIVITEVGLYGSVTGYTSSEYLFVRDLLLTPITLLKNESAIFKYTFTYQYP